MNSMKQIIFTLGLISLCDVGFADNIRLGRPSIIGNGCSNGTFTASVAKDKSAITIIFNDYIAQAGEDVRKGLELKSCNITLPIFAPLGYRLKFVAVDLRGYVSLEGRNAKASIRTRFMIPGHLPLEYNREFNNNFDDDFLFRNVFTKDAWTVCSGATYLSFRTELKVRASPFTEHALATIDSIDAFGEPMKFDYLLEKCG